VGGVNVLATFVSVASVDSIGRKPLLVQGGIQMIISLVSGCLGLLRQEHPSGDPSCCAVLHGPVSGWEWPAKSIHDEYVHASGNRSLQGSRAGSELSARSCNVGTECLCITFALRLMASLLAMPSWPTTGSDSSLALLAGCRGRHSRHRRAGAHSG
jgi:hypothetical protein